MRSIDGFFLVLLYLPWTAADNISKRGCPSKCGNLTVPYPFGIGMNSSCSINPLFEIICDASSNPPKATLHTYDLEVVGISETQIRVKNRLTELCYGQYVVPSPEINLLRSPFSISTENKLTVVGCDESAVLVSIGNGHEGYDPIASCSAICSNPQELSNGSCSGIGCCQSSIPKGLQSSIISFNGPHSRISNVNFSSCGYSFLAEQSTCNQTGNATCHQNSVCVDSGSTLGGYRCNCAQGYQGNPYLSPGCQDINECDIKPCHQDATCTNLPGSFNCSCRLNYIGNGKKHGTGCIYISPQGEVTRYAVLLASMGLFFMLLVSFWLYKLLRKRRMKQQKRNNFERNGGFLLQQQMSAEDCILEKMRIFTCKELEKATDRFNTSRILGRGGQGTVYKGMLSDGRTIAVKKSKQENQSQLQEFINEVVILSQVKHRNVVELLGCCLETQVPLLVYQFIPNGTLYNLIHDHDTGVPFSWDIRLRIATEIANALAYIHYATSVPVYHRDMKSTNILLDEKYRAKLSDFGISRSVVIDQTHLTTKVKGTLGYLDPEYFRTGKFTEKSDVYSFGVVLVELLTGQKPVATSTTKEEDDNEERSLVWRFLSAMEENRLKTILDSRISEQGATVEVKAVSDVAKRCLNLRGKKRPTIREVAMELENITTCQNPSNVDRESGSIVLTQKWV